MCDSGFFVHYRFAGVLADAALALLCVACSPAGAPVTTEAPVTTAVPATQPQQETLEEALARWRFAAVPGMDDATVAALLDTAYAAALEEIARVPDAPIGTITREDGALRRNTGIDIFLRVIFPDSRMGGFVDVSFIDDRAYLPWEEGRAAEPQWRVDSVDLIDRAAAERLWIPDHMGC